MKDTTSKHVPDCLNDPRAEGFKSVVNKFQEEIYHSRKKEPLGKKAEMNYVFPEATKTDGFRFGVATVDSETTAKHLLHNCVGLTETPDTRKMYHTSHGSTRPGEQKDREYNWPFNKDRHVFGKAFPAELDQAKRCLQPEANE